MSIFNKNDSLDNYIIQNSSDLNMRNEYFLKQLRVIIKSLEKSSNIDSIVLNGYLSELKLLKNIFISNGNQLAIYELELGIKIISQVITHLNVTGKLNKKKIKKIIDYLNISYFKIQNDNGFDLDKNNINILFGSDFIIKRLENISNELENNKIIDLTTYNNFSKEFGIMRKICQSIEDTQNDHRSLESVIQKLTIFQDTFSYRDKFKKTISDVDKSYLIFEIRKLKNIFSNLLEHDIIPNDSKEKKWIEYANENLASKLKKDDFFSISLKQLIENFLNNWNKIILELIKLNDIKYDNKELEWYEFAYQLFNKILHIFTQGERLIYVGIGFVIASFFVYFLSLSS
tara:strand:- start:17 stop:1051 length:1035 start_codon:yes stop_codon:yes gene_type:complete